MQRMLIEQEKIEETVENKVKLKQIITKHFDCELQCKRKEIENIDMKIKKVESLMIKISAHARAGQKLNSAPPSNSFNSHFTPIFIQIDENKFIQLKCKICKRELFFSQIGFLGHLKTIHSLNYTLEDAIKEHGEDIEERDVPQSDISRYIPYYLNPQNMSLYKMEKDNPSTLLPNNNRLTKLSPKKRKLSESSDNVLIIPQKIQKANSISQPNNKRKEQQRSKLTINQYFEVDKQKTEEREKARKAREALLKKETNLLNISSNNLNNTINNNNTHNNINTNNTNNNSNNSNSNHNSSSDEEEDIDETQKERINAIMISRATKLISKGIALSPPILSEIRSSPNEIKYKVKKRLIVGNTSSLIPMKERNINDDITHKWKVYVKGSENETDISYFIRKVRFYLDISFAPNHIVQVNDSPFAIKRSGWGEFPVKIEIFFISHKHKTITFNHQLKLEKISAEAHACESTLNLNLDSQYFLDIYNHQQILLKQKKYIDILNNAVNNIANGDINNGSYNSYSYRSKRPKKMRVLEEEHEVIVDPVQLHRMKLKNKLKLSNSDIHSPKQKEKFPSSSSARKRSHLKTSFLSNSSSVLSSSSSPSLNPSLSSSSSSASSIQSSKSASHINISTSSPPIPSLTVNYSIHNIEDKTIKLNVEKKLKKLAKIYPLITQQAPNYLTYTCAANLDEWQSWNIGKQRASEWQRARKIKFSLLNDIGVLVQNKFIILWLREKQFSPYVEIVLLEPEETPDPPSLPPAPLKPLKSPRVSLIEKLKITEKKIERRLCYCKYCGCPHQPISEFMTLQRECGKKQHANLINSYTPCPLCFTFIPPSIQKSVISSPISSSINISVISKSINNLTLAMGNNNVINNNNNNASSLAIEKSMEVIDKSRTNPTNINFDAVNRYQNEQYLPWLRQVLDDADLPLSPIGDPTRSVVETCILKAAQIFIQKLTKEALSIYSDQRKNDHESERPFKVFVPLHVYKAICRCENFDFLTNRGLLLPVTKPSNNFGSK